MFVEIGRWRVSAEHSQDHMDMCRDIMATQKLHPEKFLYTKSCLFRLDEAGAAEETWIYIDEYQDRETYDRQKKIEKEDPEMVALNQKWKTHWDSMGIGPTKTEGHLLEQFRVEFEGRAGTR